MDSNISIENLSKLIIFSKYAKYDNTKQRRETWEEICDRVQTMHVSKFPKFKDEITKAFDLVREKKVVPSMRSMQFGGRPIELNNSRLYNCSFLTIKNQKDFSEIMFLLLGGTGVGFSVQSKHISQLPPIQKPVKTKKFLIGDSIEGWADAIRALFKTYMSGTAKPLFDYSDIRPKGAILKTAGGKAPGPEPLRRCINKIESILESKEEGDKLKPIEVHDIVCHIADAVLSGGIRRSACISLFDKDDDEMLNCKGNFPVEVVNGGFHLNPKTQSYEGEVFYKNKAHFISLSPYSFEEFSKLKTLPWYYFEPQRARSNNSVVLKRSSTTREEFDTIFTKTKLSGAGEPGFFWTNNYDVGTNPCAEISLVGSSFCNLTEVNVSTLASQEDLEKRVEAATLLGTLQASFTDFHYLSSAWKENTEKDSLLGVSLTGIADIEYNLYDWTKAANVAVETNKVWSDRLGIRSAARITSIKPSGTTSLALGTASGIHSRYSKFYKRNIRYNKTEPIAQYMIINHPEAVEDEIGNPSNIVVTLPIKSPEKSRFRTEHPVDFLKRLKYFSKSWIKNGHVTGDNKHNISCTINVSSEKEWEEVREWMWTNREIYNGISLLPYDNGTYVQAPFQEITEDEYNTLFASLKEFDFTKVIEMSDLTDLKGEVACGANGCEIS